LTESVICYITLPKKIAVSDYQFRLIIYDAEEEVIVQWKN